MKKNIPNLITSLNIFSGVLAIMLLVYGYNIGAVICILMAMIFDFLDGFAARKLNAYSNLGKELDSLADVISFGVAPAAFAHFLIRDMMFGSENIVLETLSIWNISILFSPLIIPVFAAFRLARFNVYQSESKTFIGMPTPANAVFWLGLMFTRHYSPDLYTYMFGSIFALLLSVLVTSLLMTSELPMFSFKVESLKWKANELRYIYLGLLLITVFIFGWAFIVFAVPLYIILSIIMLAKKQ